MNPRTGPEITADMQNELARDPRIFVVDLDVTSLNGHVFISGMTDTESSKKATEEAARRVPGVRLGTNAIVVDAEAFDLQTESDIRTEVQRARAADPAVSLARVDIQVLDGVVSLSGTLDSRRDRRLALADASAVPGVKQTIDSIMVPREDDEARSR